MEKHKQILSMISLAKRAGKVVFGFDAVCEELSKKQWNTVFVASDLSEKTNKEIQRECKKHFFMHITLPLSMDDLSVISHKKVGVLCITNQSFAIKIKTLCEEYFKEEMR